MNIFILSTGRCGSTTFINACKHISNYSSAHESLTAHTGIKRLAYPAQHIESDNRLSWFLGRLDKKYGNSAFYVHLSRNKQQTIESFSKRENFGIMKAYKEAILLHCDENQNAENIAKDYIETIDSNIELFLKDKTSKMNFSLENAPQHFEKFWNKISAKGDLNAALEEFKINYNAS